MVKHLPVIIFLLSFNLYLFPATAQNCTISAGADKTICEGQPFTLSGTATGTFEEQPVWTQISGPAVTVSSTVTSSGTATATVTGYTGNVDYTFRLSAKCADGSPLSDEAVYKTSLLTVANAGPTQFACAGTITMAANAVQSGETGTWSLVSGSVPTPFPANSPNATVFFQPNSSGTAVYRWTITNGSCTSSSDMTVLYRGGVSPVTATSPVNAGNCYSLTTSVNVSGSFAGTGNGQQGSWSFISGPSIPVFANRSSNNTTVSNLIGGTYKVRWTAFGDCVNGSADVIINVPPPTQDVTSAGGASYSFCDGRVNTVLTGPKPLYTNETVQWTANAGNPGNATIVSPNSPSTVISNLAGSGVYNFTYTITNGLTNCSSSGTYTFRYTTTSLISVAISSPQVLSCGVTQLSVPYNISGGNSTQWALVSGPANSAIAQTSGFNNYVNASSPQIISGMNVSGSYVIRFRRVSAGSTGGCTEGYSDITIVASKAPYTANAGPAQTLACNAGSATLSGNAPQAGESGTGQWSQINGPNNAVIADKFNNRSVISNLQPGIYTFRWTVSAGAGDCSDNQGDTKVIVPAVPSAANAGSDVTTCYGTPVRLNANTLQSTESGVWSLVSEAPYAPASNVSFSSITDPAAIVTGLLPNKAYTLRWTISNACGSSSDDMIISTSNTRGPKQALAGPDRCLASDSTKFTLAGNGPSAGETGTWTLLAGAPNTPAFSSDSNTVVTNVIAGTYKFEWKLESGSCNASRDTIIITISAPTTVAVITGGATQNICGTNTLTLSANRPAAAETGLWTQVAGPGGITILNPGSYNTATVSGLAAGQYKFRWTISNNTCSQSSADIVYNIGLPPTTAIAGPDQTLCDVTSTTMAANTISTGTGLWSFVSGPGTPVFSSMSNPAATVSNLTAGTYVMRWTSSNGPACPASSSTVTLKVNQSANAGPDQALCNTTVTSVSGNEGTTGSWSQTAGPSAAAISTVSGNTAAISNLQPGTYTFKYTISTGGCGNNTDLMNVVVSGSPSTADAGPDREICLSSTNSVTLGAVTPAVGTGQWSFLSKPTGSTAIIANPSSPTTALTNISAGVYLLEWSVSSANCSGIQSNRDIARVTAYAVPTTAAPMANQTSACQNGVVLTGTTPLAGLGLWTYVSGGTSVPVIDAPNSPVTGVSNLNVAPGNPYIFKWTISNGICASSSSTVSINVSDVSPGAANAGPDIIACANDGGGKASAVLAANTAVNGTGTWTIVTKPAVSSPVIANANAENTTISNLSPGAYQLRWTISNSSSCSSSDDVFISVFPPPSIADAGPATANYCLYAAVKMAAVPPTVGTGSWSTVSKPAGSVAPAFSSVNAANATLNGLTTGTYVFRWTTSNGSCPTSQDDITVNIQTCQIAIAKSAGTSIPRADGSFDVTFTFRVKNTGTVQLNNIQVQDNLALTFPSPRTFTKLSLSAGGSLAANTAFNGSTDENLLNSAASSLGPGAEEIITLVVNVKLN